MTVLSAGYMLFFVFIAFYFVDFLQYCDTVHPLPVQLSISIAGGLVKMPIGVRNGLIILYEDRYSHTNVEKRLEVSLNSLP